jgi:aminopeptidase N
MRTQDHIAIKLADYRPYPFSINHVALAFSLEPERTIVTSRLLIERKPGEDGATPLRLDGEGLELVSIKLDGAALNPSHYTLSPSQLTIQQVPASFRLEIVVAIDPARNTALSGLYMSGGRYCTQCEAEGFRHITFWPDRPDVMSRFHVRLEADQEQFPTLLSNGNRVAQGQFDDGRHWAEWDDPHPKPSYLFALVAGDFDTITDSFTTMSNRDVTLTIYVDKGQANSALYAMDALKRSMLWDEEVFGREYDLDVFNIVAVSDFNFGAMENKGLNIFNSALLIANEQTATDLDYEAIEAVVAHEYFHNWSGNRVTCRDWFQLSLKEGFTVFRDQEFSSDQRSRAVKRIKDVRALRARQFSEDSGPLAHPVRPSSYVKIDNFYTATVYEKGAEVIRVLKTLIGAEAFSLGADIYFADNDGRAATIEDWLQAMRTASGNPLINFENWYDQAGTPVLDLTFTHDSTAGTIKLVFKQHTPDTPGQAGKKWVPIPISMAFFGHDGGLMQLNLVGNPTKADTWLVPMASDTLTLEFEGATQNVVPSVLRGFSAPVRLVSNHTQDDLSLLAMCDTDAFVRWESTQAIARTTLLKVADDIKASIPLAISDGLARILGSALSEANTDPAFGALMLRLPDVGELMQLRQNCDPEDLHAARNFVRKVLADQLEPALEAAFVAYDPAKPFSPSAEDAGARALAGAALELLCAQGGDRNALRAENFFYSARNMTDMMAALVGLSEIGGPRYESALESFKERFSDNLLVMDKWFRVQAMASSGDGAATFTSLRHHRDFNILNPNRVRALAGAFAMGNYKSFHRRDGVGYQIVCELLADVDGVNPAVAARLCTLFESTARVDANRRALAHGHISQLLARNTLSSNAREILEKIASGLVQAE